MPNTVLNIIVLAIYQNITLVLSINTPQKHLVTIRLCVYNFSMMLF